MASLFMAAVFAASCLDDENEADEEEAKCIDRMLKQFDFENKDGVYIYLTEKGDEYFNSTKDTISIQYTCTVLQNGYKRKEEKYAGVINDLFYGWQVALRYIPHQSTGKLILPYRYAYGQYTVDDIDAYSTLLFDFHVD